MLVELWTALVVGAPLLALDAGTLVDPARLARGLLRGRATVWMTTPARWARLSPPDQRRLLQGPGADGGLRLLALGGERTPARAFLHKA